MKIYNPNEYPVEYEADEVEILEKAYYIFKNTYEEMKKRDCVVLESCEDNFEITKVDFIKNWLERFLSDIPTKMY